MDSAGENRRPASQLVTDEPEGDDSTSCKAADRARRRRERQRTMAEQTAFVPDHTEAWAELAHLRPEDTVVVDEDGQPLDGRGAEQHRQSVEDGGWVSFPAALSTPPSPCTNPPCSPPYTYPPSLPPPSPTYTYLFRVTSPLCFHATCLAAHAIGAV